MNYKIKSPTKTDIDKLIYLYKSKDFSSALNLSNKLIKLKQGGPFLFNIKGKDLTL